MTARPAAATSATSASATSTSAAADPPGVTDACAVYDVERDSAGVPRLHAFPPLEVLREFNYADSNAWWPKLDVDAQASLLAVGAPGVVYVYDFVTGRLLATLDIGIVRESGAPVLSVAFAPGQRYAAVFCLFVLFRRLSVGFLPVLGVLCGCRTSWLRRATEGFADMITEKNKAYALVQPHNMRCE